MNRLSYADELESAAERIAELSHGDLAIMLRRAALRLRNSTQVPLDPEWEDALNSVASELRIGRNDLVRQIVKDWLIANAYLPVHLMEEDSAVEGEA